MKVILLFIDLKIWTRVAITYIYIYLCLINFILHQNIFITMHFQEPFRNPRLMITTALVLLTIQYTEILKIFKKSYGGIESFWPVLKG